MHRFVSLIIAAALLTSASAALAQSAGNKPYDGDIQAYGAPWRYQHRDWSSARHPLDPGVCWYRNDHTGGWVWKC
jgi:hypothetical protein